jgi:hypothetical protein
MREFFSGLLMSSPYLKKRELLIEGKFKYQERSYLFWDAVD